MHYGDFLTRLRGERGLTQIGLAEAASISLEAVKQAEKHAGRRMFPRTFLAIFNALYRLKPLSAEDISRFAEWSGIAIDVFLAAVDATTPHAKRIIEQPDLPPLNASLSNAITACLLKMSQAQLADILYEVAQTLTRAQIEQPLPPGTAKPTTITGPGLLGLQHPDDNGYRVTVYFEPRKDLLEARPSRPPRIAPEPAQPKSTRRKHG